MTPKGVTTNVCGDYYRSFSTPDLMAPKGVTTNVCSNPFRGLVVRDTFSPSLCKERGLAGFLIWLHGDRLNQRHI
jgi:hypothetical protein